MFVLSGVQKKMSYERFSELRKLIRSKHPELCSGKKFERYLNKYLYTCEWVLANHLHRNKSLESIIQFSRDDASRSKRHGTGQAKIGDKRPWIFKYYDDRVAMFADIETGCNLNANLTKSMLNKNYKEAWSRLFALNTETHAEQMAEEQKVAEATEGQIELKTPIMVNRLRAAISNAEARLEVIERYNKRYGSKKNVLDHANKNDRIEYFATLKRAWTREDIVTAKAILKSATEYGEKFLYRDNTYMLPQVFEQSDHSARLYAKGLNLQNCSKKVRKAAIGKGYQYDINASSYSLLYGLYQSLTGKELPHIEAYITNKQKVRDLVVGQVFGEKTTRTETKIKLAFVALGFGAKVNNYGEALERIFYGDEKHTFLNSEFMASFLSEWAEAQEAINKWAKSIKTKQVLYPNTVWASPATRSKTTSYVYQCLERMVLDLIKQYCEARDKQIILYLHDAIITTTKLDAADFTLFLKNSLDDIGKWLSLDEEVINEKDYLPEANTLDIQHNRRIALEEQQAKNYKNSYGVDWTSQTEIRLQQEQLYEQWLA